jgi:tetratricopeptide (TPR) repeat protein
MERIMNPSGYGYRVLVGQLFLLAILLILVAGTLVPLTRIRDERPLDARLSFYPPAPVIKTLSADHYQFLSHVISLQCIFYFGTLVEERGPEPDWNRIYQVLYTSTRLDPYNMDAYYFAQAVLSWDARMPRRAIELLEYGFSYRDWDWYLPFFISFDYAFFLKDYTKAAEYLEKAAALNPRASWFSTLAARYYYEGGSTALALAYLQELIPIARNESIRKHLVIRALALERILQLEEAVAAYTERFKRSPKTVEELVEKGFVEIIPKDPYGGTLYLYEQGKVRTTSKLAFGKGGHGVHKN